MWCDPIQKNRERMFTFQNAPAQKKPFSEKEQSARKRIEVYVLTIKHTHRDNFVDRFLRRRGLGDDLDASKLGGECKHLFISMVWISFVKATARRGGGSSRKNKQTEKRSLFAGRDPKKKGKKGKRAPSRLKKKQQSVLHFIITHSTRVITFYLPAIKKRTRAEMRDTFIE